MKIEVKITALLVLIVLFITIIMLIYRNYNENKFLQLFNDEKKNVETTFAKLVDLKKQEVHRFADNFTYWDDMVNFVTINQNESWAAENIDTAIVDFKVNSIWVYGIDGSPVYFVNNLNDNTLEKILLPKEAITSLFKQNRFCYFYINTSKGIMEINGATIHPTADYERKTSPRGYFLVGRLLNNDYVSELSRLIGGDANITTNLNMAGINDSKSQKNGIISFSKILNNRDGFPLATINVIVKSGIVYNINQTLENTFIFSIIFILLIAGVIIFFFIYWINIPLKLISRTLSTENLNYSKNLQKTQNEFGDITRLISNFFEQRVYLIKEIVDHKLAEEKLLESNRLLEETLDELKDTQQKISQQDRLIALGQLASGIAHDFNNALTPIIGYSDMILGIPEIQNDRKRMMDYLKIINTASSDARVVVDRLRDFYRSREESDIFTPINLNQLIQQSIQLTQPKWKNQSLANSVTVNIITDIQQIPQISGNEAELREVITNLVFNSVDAISANGSISLRTYADNENVVFEISDTGIGMSEETKKHCFEPFFTNKGERGTGLGLSIVYGTIQRHNGTIEVESEIGKGTTFRIRLPITEEIQDKQKEQKSESILKPLHVLVIDDEVLIQDMLGEYLSIDGHTFALASNGREGLDKFRSGSFELVITDRAMPDIGGDQLAFMIKQITTKVPVIMITGFGSLMKASGELPKNVDYLLSKPITLLEFRQTLKTAKELMFQQQ